MDEERKNDEQEQSPAEAAIKKRSNTLFYAVAAIILLGAIASFAAFYFHITKKAVTVQETASMYPNFTQEQVQIKQIATPFGLHHYESKGNHYIADTELSDSSPGKFIYDGKVVYEGTYVNSYINDNGQHYLIQTPDEIIYDGKTVYQGSDIDSIELSNNGEHYAFTKLYEQNFTELVDIYVDGKLIAKGIEDFFGIERLSDDGKNISYTTKVAEDKYNIYKNNRELITQTNAIFGIEVDDKGTIIRSPEKIPSVTVHSDNGKHKLMVTKASCNDKRCLKVYVDEKLVHSGDVKTPYLINNEGKFAFFAYDGVYLQSTYFQLPSVENMKQVTIREVQINKAQTHYLAHYGFECSQSQGSHWYLDGRQIQLPTQSCDDYALLIDNAIYVFNVSKDAPIPTSPFFPFPKIQTDYLSY